MEFKTKIKGLRSIKLIDIFVFLVLTRKIYTN